MPRRRMIDPSIWDDPDVGELSPSGFKLFIGCISLADDEGRLDADPRTLRKCIFGFHQQMTVDEVRTVRDDMVHHLSNVCLYAVDGKEYIALLQWAKHQAIGAWKKPSEYPTPPGQEQTTIEDDAEQVPTTIPDDAEHDQGTIPPIEVNRIELKPIEGKQQQASKPAAAGVAFALQA